MTQRGIPTTSLGHYAFLWLLATCLWLFSLDQRIDDGHWVAVFNEARLHPIPPAVWLAAFIPSCLTSLGGLIVVLRIMRPERNLIAEIEGLCAAIGGGYFAFITLVGWCLHEL